MISKLTHHSDRYLKSYNFYLQNKKNRFSPWSIRIREHFVDAFRPDPNSWSSKRPISVMNIASGLPIICQLDKLISTDREFIKYNTIFIKIKVDCYYRWKNNYTNLNYGELYDWKTRKSIFASQKFIVNLSNANFKREKISSSWSF